MKLSMTIAQKQILSQHMQQSAQILQMSTVSLLEYMQNLSMENPVVEWEESQKEQEYEKVLKKIEWLDASDEQNKKYYQEEQEDREENDDWKFQKQMQETLEEYLLFQINILPIEQKKKKVLSFLAESIDENGYLEKDSLQAAKKLFGLSKVQLQEILSQFQALEPPGVGAGNLQECLLLQLKRKEKKYPLCEKIIEQYLKVLAKNQLHIIAKELKVKMVEVVEASNMIKTLSPKPGRGFSSNEKIEYVLPDVEVKQKSGQLVVLCNTEYLPSLKINPYYKDVLLMDTSPAAREYIISKIRQAEWVLQCITKREVTLKKIVECIVEMQQEFFLQKQDALLPMRLCDVAEKINIHESTVSRAIKEKYLQCYQGIFPLSYFFSTGISTKSKTAVSADSIKKQMIKWIEKEDKKKPFSDRVIAEMFQAQGIEISRRTIAKYRDSLAIAEASMRKIF